MSNVFFTADLHLGHKGIVEFIHAPTGEPMRPWDDIDEMNEALIANWNKTVGPKDKVYVLGDVVMNRRCMPLIGRLQGRKTLVGGNHDTMRAREYAEYFEEQKGCIDFSKERWVLTHIPVHPCQLERWKANVHGHMHANKVDDPRYLCVSVEHTNYTPISREEVKARLLAQQEG